jgi:hypothetical protein
MQPSSWRGWLRAYAAMMWCSICAKPRSQVSAGSTYGESPMHGLLQELQRLIQYASLTGHALPSGGIDQLGKSLYNELGLRGREGMRRRWRRPQGAETTGSMQALAVGPGMAKPPWRASISWFRGCAPHPGCCPCPISHSGDYLRCSRLARHATRLDPVSQRVKPYSFGQILSEPVAGLQHIPRAKAIPTA